MPTAAPTDLGLDHLVDATPTHRDRTVDAVRALCIVVVVLWHWVFSITHVSGSGALSMPNPIDEIPGGWLATWVLQVMPAFFIVGGFANLASWQRLERDGTATWRTYAAGRMARLWRPLAAVVVVWGIGDTVARSVLGVPSVLTWGIVVFVPLWFLAAYSAVLLLAPLTIGAHRRRPVATLVGLAGGIAAADALRFTTGEDRWGYLTTALVWVAAHQLGYLWRDGSVTGWSRRAQGALVAGAAGALAVLTTVGPYPTSMVAVRGGELSNMFPTTAPIAVLAVLQLGLIALLRPTAERWLARRGPWRGVIAVNAVAMTVFAWHMTALVAVIGAAHGLGLTLPAETSPTWWLMRPVWLVLPGVALAGLVAVFARLELPSVGADRPESFGRARMPVMVKKLLGVVAVVVLVLVGVGVWYFVIRDDSVEKASGECDPAPCEASTVDSIDGTWSVAAADSEGTLVITETIGGVADHQVEGKTGEVTGTVEVADTSVTEASFTVDMTALEFTDTPPVGNVANRATAMKTSGLQTDDFPEATFALTGPIDLGDGLSSGEPTTAEATGDLTIHGVTNPITFTVEVTADGDTFRVTPTDFIPVVLEDYDMEVSAPGFVADIADEGSFDFLLILEQAG